MELDLVPSMVELIDRLVKQTGAATRAEAIRLALSIAAVLVEEQAAGKRIELRDGKGRLIERLRVV